ncbi:LUD domain-containing protein [Streptomyces polygonati]|uniref:LUD domain-containing protein n=1 Tax=Streptomyces polygonati TaxID=1617087 RepID=A0ABV8HZ64_9ACTN
MRSSGIAADIDQSGRYRSLRAEQADWDMATRSDDVRVTRSAPDVVVGSVHAVTEDGKLVTASASGSQLAPYAFGAARAVWVVGAQKIVPDLATALRRGRSAPATAVRWRAAPELPKMTGESQGKYRPPATAR